ncbi:hypothetical protein H2198_004452 [Neophaeococcomyces mojaviensis]|uniref:Uncharacterized protein n=1 Tax=Neophaeococcomyces mojaviensis TaxID=3383035 RepID=A0ACC3A8I3_9EURO|nr:hypothetical protein H2198_004452 [Knufia sp. JES_112]
MHSWYFPDGKAWRDRFGHHDDSDEVSANEELLTSIYNGCELCSLLRRALDEAEPVGSVVKREKAGIPILRHGWSRPAKPKHKRHPEDTGIILAVREEGELEVTDATRVGQLLWRTPEMGLGYAKKAIIFEAADSPGAYKLCQKWLEICQSSHPQCKIKRSKDGLAPKRLIQVDNEDHGTFNIRLVLSAALLPTDEKYVALSHCWGGGTGFVKTTKSNVDQRYISIDWVELSKTFKDSIKTVHALGSKYLWIDSLCIVQDDADEIVQECAKMEMIYSCADFTICAADAANGLDGLFMTRDRTYAEGISIRAKNIWTVPRGGSLMEGVLGRFDGNPANAEVFIYPKPKFFARALQGPLSTRGWTLQERELSPRILHFTRDRILWECRTCIASEDEPEMALKTEVAKAMSAELSPERVLDSQNLVMQSRKQGMSSVKSAWSILVEMYSRRQLSVATDKLVAIAGIARSIAAKRDPNDKYLAGLWRDGLLTGLCWYPEKSRNTIGITGESRVWPPTILDNRIPSWSWASYNGSVKHYGDDWFGGYWKLDVDNEGKETYVKVPETIKVVEAEVTLSTKDAYGAISQARIKLDGFGAFVQISEDMCSQTPRLLSSSSRKCYGIHIAQTTESSPRWVEDTVPGDSSWWTNNAVPRGRALVSNDAFQRSSATENALVYFDTDPDKLVEQKFVLFQLGTGKPPHGGKPDRICGLVLLEIQAQPKKYRRVGMFDVYRNDVYWGNAKRKMTVLIV